MYKITKRYAKGPETLVDSYKTLNEAKNIIQEKLAEDAAHKVNITYCLYEDHDLIEDFDQSKLIISSNSGSGESGGGMGKGSKQSFSPTPFSMTPQPKGVPRTSTKDNENKEDEK